MAAVAQAAIARVMEEWNFKDWATAEAFYKAQQHQLQSRKDRKLKSLLQVLGHLDQSFWLGCSAKNWKVFFIQTRCLCCTKKLGEDSYGI